MPAEASGLTWIQVQTAYGSFAYPISDAGGCTLSLAHYGEWAGLELDFCSHFIRPGDSVIDGGGFIGTHAVAFSSMVGPKGFVLSVESQPESHAILERNLSVLAKSSWAALHGVLGRGKFGTYHIAALGRHPGTSYGSASVRTLEAQEAGIQVQAYSLDGICEAWPRPPSFVKLDLEGMEDLALQGGHILCPTHHPTIYAEVNSLEAAAAVRQQMLAYGYEVWMHIPAAYNPQNYRANRQNVFGDLREAALVGVYGPAVEIIQGLGRLGQPVFRIDTMDDLAAGMLLKPQYAAEVLEKTTAAEAWPWRKPWRR